MSLEPILWLTTNRTNSCFINISSTLNTSQLDELYPGFPQRMAKTVETSYHSKKYGLKERRPAVLYFTSIYG